MPLRKWEEVQEVSRNPSAGLAKTLLLHLLYNCFYLAALLIGLPYLAVKFVTQERFRAGLVQRCGWVPPRTGDKPCLWLHGVSVGELLAASRFLALYRAAHPDWEVVVTTTTLAGYKVARQQYGDLKVFYYPIDFSFVVNRVFRRIRPSLVVLIELELWPNFLLAARRRGIPVALVNGRISDRSFRGYRVWRRLMGRPFGQISLFCVQNKKYAARLRALGVPRDDVVVTGTMKYDTIVTEGMDDLKQRMLETLRIQRGSTVLICGSTHPPEERILLNVSKHLVESFPGLVLVLAPRRPERIDEVESEIRNAGFRSVRKSTLTPSCALLEEGDVLLVDTMGELSQIYSAADVVFVGGTLIPHGGQNMMEPAGLGKAVLFGESVRNFQDSVDLLMEHDAAVMVEDGDHLLRELETLLADDGKVSEMGQRAQELIRSNQGASRHSLDIVGSRFQDLFESAEAGVETWRTSDER